MKAVNPAYGDLTVSTKNNCMLCTTTYEMRQRGYDVIANKVNTGFTTETIKDWFPDAKTHSLNDKEKYFDNSASEWRTDSAKAIRGKNTEHAEAAVKMLSKEPSGSRGNIIVTWAYGMGGHSMAYEKENGKLVVRDCQNGKKYTEEQFKKQVLSRAINTEYVRLDNVDFDPEKIKRCSR